MLAAIASLIIILIGFLFKQFEPLAGEKAVLKGENKFLFDRNMPDEVIDELAWGSEAILTSTAAAAILIHNDGVNILRRGITSSNDFKPGETCLRSIKVNFISIETITPELERAQVLAAIASLIIILILSLIHI